ncbi:MAG: DUF5661 family protein, partial [Clostridia bacterium]
MEAKKDSTTIQSIIFDKDKFTKGQSIKWLAKNDYKTAVHVTDDYYRYRQIEPSEFNKDTFRTIELDKGIKAIVGKLKEKYKKGGEVEGVNTAFSDSDNIIFAKGGLISDTGTLYSKHGHKLDYKKHDKGYNFTVYEPIETVVNTYTKHPYKKREDGFTESHEPMGYDNFIAYLNENSFIYEKFEKGGEIVNDKYYIFSFGNYVQVKFIESLNIEGIELFLYNEDGYFGVADEKTGTKIGSGSQEKEIAIGNAKSFIEYEGKDKVIEYLNNARLSPRYSKETKTFEESQFEKIKDLYENKDFEKLYSIISNNANTTSRKGLSQILGRSIVNYNNSQINDLFLEFGYDIRKINIENERAKKQKETELKQTEIDNINEYKKTEYPYLDLSNMSAKQFGVLDKAMQKLFRYDIGVMSISKYIKKTKDDIIGIETETSKYGRNGDLRAVPLTEYFYKTKDDFLHPIPKLAYDNWIGFENQTENLKEKEVESLSDKYDIPESEVKTGLHIEEEHRDTVEKLYNKEITPEEGVKEIFETHEKESKDYYDKDKGLPAMEEKLKDTIPTFEDWYSQIKFNTVGGYILPDGTKGLGKKSMTDWFKKLYNNRFGDKSQILQGGIADNKTIESIAKKHNIDNMFYAYAQLKKGVSVEMEHTNNKDIAKEIALDHLSESMDYYNELEKMEEKLKEESFTEAVIVNKGWREIKAKLGERKARKYFEQVDILFNPNKVNIVEYRVSGVITKENGKYIFNALSDTDFKKWRVSFTNDISEQFTKTKTNEDKKPSLNKQLIREVDIRGEKVKIYSVDATFVRINFHADFNSGGHYLGWGNGEMN